MGAKGLQSKKQQRMNNNHEGKGGARIKTLTTDAIIARPGIRSGNAFRRQ